jgi:PIN like domain
MEFFIDRNVPEKLARMLGHYDREHAVIFLDDWFDPKTPDVEWLEDLASRSPVPVVISGDGRILRNPAELQVLRSLPLTFFLFAPSWCTIPWHERAWKTIKVWPQVVKNASPTKPSIFSIPISATKVEFMAYTNEAGRIRKRR